tara:strand:- start:2811 stop:3098 length:288 start_codon:yes stop_codon:yes gene_type:complete
MYNTISDTELMGISEEMRRNTLAYAQVLDTAEKDNTNYRNRTNVSLGGSAAPRTADMIANRKKLYGNPLASESIRLGREAIRRETLRNQRNSDYN